MTILVCYVFIFVTGAAISVFWCISEPDGAVDGVDERGLLVDPRNPQYCYYDVNDNFTANYICEQGPFLNDF